MFSRGYSYLSSSLNGQIKKEYFVEADIFSISEASYRTEHIELTAKVEQQICHWYFVLGRQYLWIAMSSAISC